MQPAVELNHVSKSFRVRRARRAGVTSRVHVAAARVRAGGWAAAYLALAVLVFDRGLRRYASGSRFSTFG